MTPRAPGARRTSEPGGSPTLIVVMGVAGAGKSTVGRELATALGRTFRDADALHSDRNRARMRHGEALTEADREPWLMRLEELVHQLAASRTAAVLACSALRERYRARLRAAAAEVGGTITFVYLRVDRDLAEQRLRARTHHFMPPELVASQFAVLEPPVDAITVDASQSVDELVTEIRSALDTRKAHPDAG